MDTFIYLCVKPQYYSRSDIILELWTRNPHANLETNDSE